MLGRIIGHFPAASEMRFAVPQTHGQHAIFSTST
jgi:hypothetical protein